MSMIRQLALLLAAVVIFAVGGSAWVAASTARDSLRSQWQVRNGDAASLLALAMSQQRGDTGLMSIVLEAQFNAGHYRSIRLVASDGTVVFERESPVLVGDAPAWLRSALPLEAPAGIGLVSDGWRSVGRVQVQSHAAWAYEALWASLVQASAWLLLVGIVALIGAVFAVHSWRRGLDAVLQQAQALELSRFTEIREPRTLELRRLATGMNAMVRRLRSLFDSHATQLELMRRKAHHDALTGLSNRSHFVAKLERALQARRDAPALAEAPRRGCLLIVRLRQLEAMNQRLGRDGADRVLAAAGEVLQTYRVRAPGAFAGRLNGGDLALYLPVNGMGEETALALTATLRALLQTVDPGGELCIGGVDGLATGGVSDAIARADEALASAEVQGPFAAHIIASPSGVEPVGESEWRRRIAQALAAGRTRIAEHAVVDAHGRTLHLECPLRVQLVADGPFDSAARWMPMATRGRLTQQVDLAAAALVLHAIEADGIARAVHVASLSISEAGFASALARVLADMPEAAKKLLIEVAEDPAGLSPHWRDAVGWWRPHGVRLGLENAGSSLHALLDARAAGLDYVKVDGRFLRGLASDKTLTEYARQVLAAARSVGVAVYAEGIDNTQDLQVLWSLGFDGATGPAVTSAG